MGTAIVLLIISALCFVFFIAARKSRNKLKSMGFDKSSMLINVKYTCGHPNIDKPSLYNIGLKEGNIYFLSPFGKEIALIKGSDVKNIIVDDESTFRNKVTLARMALVGVFAFALQKRKKEELAYLTIDWSDGRFEHSTIFEYKGNGSLQRANTDRNKIIKTLQV